MPIHDHSLQKQVWAEIVVWLDINEDDSERPSLQFRSINVETFRALFKRLVVLAQPSYKYPESQAGQAAQQWDTEFRTALSALSYPFQVDPTWIYQPSQAHVWPFLLSICEWLLNKGKVRVGAPVEYIALAPRFVHAVPLEFGYGNGELHHRFHSYEGHKILELEDIMDMLQLAEHPHLLSHGAQP